MDRKQSRTYSPDELLLQGHQLMAQNKLLDARKCYEAVLAVQPGDFTLHINLAQIARATGDLARAEQHLRQALSLKPKSLQVQAELGLLDWRRGNDADAVIRLAQFCKAQPRNLSMAAYLAECYSALGQDDAIPDLFEAALRAGAPWTVEELLPIAHEINIDPICRRGFFMAASRVTDGVVAQRLAQRVDSDVPDNAPGAPEPWKSLLTLPAPKRVSACMIVKNEAQALGRLLSSIQGMVDEIVVVDTGSTDETIAIAESFGARIFHFSWCDDFAAARNESLKHATGDWIMLVDADHEVDVSSRRLLRRILQRPFEADAASPVFFVQLLEHYSSEPSNVDSRSKFRAVFPNRPYLRFVGALHEQLTDHRPEAPPLNAITLPEVIYHHYGYTSAVVAQQDKLERNMRILFGEIERRPEDAFVRYNYAKQLRAAQKLDEALEQIRECFRLLEVQKRDLRSPFVESAYAVYAELLVRRLEFGGVIKVCEDGLALFPDSFDLLGRLGLALLATDKIEQAIPRLEAAIRQNGTFAASGSYIVYAGCLSESLLAIAYWRLGDAERCDRHLRRALKTSTNRQKTVERFVSFCRLLLGEGDAADIMLARVGLRFDHAAKMTTQAIGPANT
jgi:tetratricopeptide (TPR) repeat protein